MCVAFWLGQKGLMETERKHSALGVLLQPPSGAIKQLLAVGSACAGFFGQGLAGSHQASLGSPHEVAEGNEAGNGPFLI